MRRAAARVWCIVVLAVLVAGFAAGAAAQVRPGAEAQSDRVMRFDVTVGKSQVIDFREAFNRVSVTNPAVADVFVVTPNQILVNGKTPGVTSLVVFYPDRTMYFDLIVQADVAVLRDRLGKLMPKSGIDISPARGSLVLSGWVPTEELVKQAAQVAEAFAPGKVVNLLRAVDLQPQQVMLQVHVAEATRGALRELGFSFKALGNSFAGGAWPGATFLPGLQPFGSLNDITSPNFGFTDLATFFLASPSRNYGGIVRALQERDLLRTLAKPNLITVSGKEAKFLSGGEFPFPVPSTSIGGVQTITIEFKPFGVQLAFTPVVREDQQIALQVTPEVSSLDFSQGLVLQGFNIPVIRSNRAATSLQLKDGDTFAMAGLINTTVRQQIAKIPLLGDIPVLGGLFRSTRFRNDETELLFLVTVKTVKPFTAGQGPTAEQLLQLRPDEQKDLTLVPGFPGVGEVVDRPIGQSNLPPATR